MSDSATLRLRFSFMFALVVAAEAVFGLPFLVARVFRPTLLDVFGITNFELGAAFSVYGVVAMAAYFFGGPLADRFSPRRLLVVALLTTSLGGIVFARIPSLEVLSVLFGFWGVSTILLFWSALIRATREWGGVSQQGRAFGTLDAGRGLFAAVLSSLAVAVFAAALGDNPANTTLEQKSDALAQAIWIFTAVTALAALLVWFGVPERSGPGESAEKFNLKDAGRVLAMPTVWLQAVIVICAYVGYKGADDFSLFARDAYGMDDVEAAKVGTISLWVRPFAALAAGLLGDRLGISRVAAGSFLALVLIEGSVALGMLPPAVPAALFLAVAGASVMIHALRGLYYAMLEEGAVPAAFTGTAVGLVSIIGYTPDIFMGPLMGYLTDASPGAEGHEHLFAVLTVFSLIGFATTLAFTRVSTGQRKALA